MKKLAVFATVFAVAATLLLFSCNVKRVVAGSNEQTEKIAIAPSEVESVLLVDNEGVTLATISEDDVAALAGILAGAEYDAALNDGGTTVRMTAPDYTLIVSYPKWDTPDDRMQIWPRRVYWRSKWFLLKDDVVRPILAKYKS